MRGAELALKTQGTTLCTKLANVLREHVWNLDDGAIARYFQSWPLPELLVHVHISTQFGDPIADLTVSSEQRISLYRQEIRYANETIGSIEVALNRVEIDALRKRTAILAVALSFLVTVATGLLSAAVLKLLLGRPLHRLAVELQTIAAGDYSVHLPPHHYREVDEINHAVNDMTKQIAESTAKLESEIEDRRQAERELQVMKVNLETLVNRRTVQLRESNANLLREHEERKRVEQQILDISTREQHRIGQDLHDALGQQLAGIAFLAASLERNLQTKGYDEASMAQQVAMLLRDAVSHTRDIAQGLSPVAVEADGLITALQKFAHKTEEVFQIECRFYCTGEGRVHSNNVAIHLFHITQEAVHNAIQHGGATNIEILLSTEGGRGSLAVRDNGSGFHPDKDGRVGMGLDTMAYRADMVSGTLDIQSNPEGGTTVTTSFANSPEQDAKD